MAKHILGISAYYHDSAAALIRDGEIIAAAQEERFTRKKHDHRFPKNASEYCMKEARIKAEDLDAVVFYDKPLIKFERILETSLTYSPLGVRSFIKAMPLWLKQKLFLPDLIKKELGCESLKILFSDHHESHAASAFYPSPFKEAAILTLDGVGEWSTLTYGIGRDNKIELIKEIRFPHSLGLLYSAFTYYIGFRVNSGEYKLMGLAPYGEGKYTELILQKLIDLKEDGSFKLNMKYFNYCAGLTMTNHRFHKLFGGLPRKSETNITQKEMDIAKSIQEVVEIVLMKIVTHVHKDSGLENLCLAGGVALNCVANGKILRNSAFKNLWIQPAATDSGGALGAALTVWHQYYENERNVETKDKQKASLLGPSFSDEEIETFLKENDIPYEKYDEDGFLKRAAEILSSEKVLGWFQGRMEFGPRALGGRSILGDPRSEKMQSIMNLKIKFRESFRPFAPSVMREHVSNYFQMDTDSPYMLLVAPVKEEIRLSLSDEQKKLFGIEKLKIKRSEIPAITHVDYSARVQTVSEEDNPRYYRLLKNFNDKTGCPVLINTSFNVRGEPIVCTPEDAFRCFLRTNMDFLALGNFILDRTKQRTDLIEVGDVSEFALD